MLILGSLLLFLIGVIMGILGSGGSILATAVLVYVFDMSATVATSYSLFIVGLSACFGSLRYAKLIAFSKSLVFIIPSVISIIWVRIKIFPHLPGIVHLPNFFGLELDLKLDSLIMLVLAKMMFSSAYLMISQPPANSNAAETGQDNSVKIVVSGCVVGILVGFVGAGGGFFIIPILVFLMGVEMRSAIATSLFIITVNSVVGIAFDRYMFDIVQYKQLSYFVFLSISGIMLGTYMSKHISSNSIKKAFGIFIAIVASAITIKELGPIAYIILDNLVNFNALNSRNIV